MAPTSDRRNSGNDAGTEALPEQILTESAHEQFTRTMPHVPDIED